ncbi:MAG: hypothetical protein JWQ23_1244 [Herminiimonas sp.]|nr:hypothetical protein [Herminiimonas sp.]
MLTATYSLVTLSIEQKNAHCGLSKLEKSIKNSVSDHAHPDPAMLASAVSRLSRFDEYCHGRRVEVYVIPAIRKATREADSLLDELESLATQAHGLLRKVREGLRMAFEQGMARVNDLCRSMELFCVTLFKRLSKDEELVRVAQRVISIDEWFVMAADFLHHDAEQRLRRRYGDGGGRRPRAHAPRTAEAADFLLA